MKKIFYISAAFVSFLLVMSCEKDFREIGGNVISNNNFTTDQITLEVETTPIDISSVRADNIAIGNLGEYWLGVYNNNDYKRVEASIISQLNITPNPRTEQNSTTDELDSIYVFNDAYLILPYESTQTGRGTNGVPEFRLDSVLGNDQVPVAIKVYRNGTFLNRLNPNDPSEQNSFESDQSYTELELLNDNPNYVHVPNPVDTILPVQRELSTGSTFFDEVKLNNSIPFIRIKLNKARMKELFWDKFGDPEFSTTDAFNQYFKGLIIKAEGTDGAMVPITLNTTRPSVEFYYTETRVEIENGARVVKDTVLSSYPFTLSGVTNSQYKMSAAQSPAPTATSFNIQGTAGSMARINILNGNELQTLRERNILINDATLTFNIDASRDTTKVPLRLFLYRETSNGDEQIKDAITEGAASFGGGLSIVDAKPSSYSFGITDYVSDLISGEIDENSPLILKVFNTPTDLAVDPSTGALRNLNVDTYNWNPRGVTILNNSISNGDKRAKLTISFTEEKEDN
ncbi:DUF4270 family protein [uncultured Tenacibaculum sp.]|uniref:DUF4270 family protein n=1 Tax=uncultured Tenacibaculum sp. TaxID=174713 RepID=UPI002634B947|nr:DUF4270 family protein [uncultured Tenacibaculum sp.]